MKIYGKLIILFVLLAMSLTTPLLRAQGEDEEDTYSISLVKTAETDKELHEIEGQKVLAETYEVADGDYVWDLLRKRGLLHDRDLPRILSALKKLNSSLSNLDLIYPGQRIIIPLKISPLEPLAAAKKEKPPLRISPEELREIDFKNYTVKPGESLIKIITGSYNIPTEKIHSEYLEMVKRLNPSITNVDMIYPGQVVKLPIYAPEVVRSSIERPPLKPPEINKPEMMYLSNQLNQIFTRIGEEWLQSGEHFIPLKPGGQVNLKTESYPLINLSNGNRIIVDLYSDLPEKMVKLIQSNWDFYRVVKLIPGSTLRSALNQILPLCDYDRLYPAGAPPFELGGDIGLSLKADWIIIRSPASEEGESKLVMIHLFHDPIPVSINKYLLSLGIESIIFPFADGTGGSSRTLEAKPLKINERDVLIAELLKATGRQVSQNVEIPVYQKQKKDFNLVIKADFLLNERGQDCIIDLHSLDQNTVSLLDEQRFKVLSLGHIRTADQLAARTLEFLNTAYNHHPHDFKVLDSRDNHIRLTIPGITFRGDHGQDILITHLDLSPEIVDFLATKGYKVFIVKKDE